MSLFIQDLIEDGISKLIAEGDAAEALKINTLRGGNSGLYDGEVVAGTCARLAYLRREGIKLPNKAKEGATHSKEYMFDGGRGNEDLIKKVLEASSWEGKILAETEVPTLWHTTRGTPVTGRPDLVLQDKEGKLVHGLELKLVSSLWTCRDVLSKPKLPHIAQATHYAWQLNIPFTITYVSRANFAVAGFAVKLFPQKGEPGSEYCSYNEKGQIKAVLPFVKTYPLEVKEDGFVHFYNGTEWVSSIVNVERLVKFYEGVDDMSNGGELLPAPMNLDAVGEEAKAWQLCDYCELKNVCDKVTTKSVLDFKEGVLNYVKAQE